MTVPPPPPGFTLDSEVPPPPAGFTRDDVGAVPPPPPGFTLDSERPGLTDYAGEVGKQAIRGVADVAAGSLRGLGARDAATAPIMGQRLDESVAGALTRGALPNVVQETPIPRRSAVESPLYQAGERVEAAAAEQFPDRNILNPVVRDVSRAVGNVGGNIVLTLLNPGLGVAGAVSQGVGEAAQRAVKKGATPEQQDLASSLGTIAGATEFADSLILFTGSAGKALGLVKRVGLNALIQAGVQGGQEGLQEFIQNAISKGVYDPEQSLTENVAYSALIGGLVGGGLGTVTAGRRQDTTPATPEDVGAAYTATVPPGAGTPAPGPGPSPIGPAPPSQTEVTPAPAPAAVATPKPTPIIPTPPATTETYRVQNPDAPNGFVDIQVGRDAEGGLQTFVGPGGRVYRVPESHRNAPINLTLAMKYGPRDGVDQRLVTRVDDLAPPTQETLTQFPGAQLLLPPPAVTPQEVAAGIEPPPRPMLPAPVVVGVPEAVNVAAAGVVMGYTPPGQAPYTASVEDILERPLNLNDEQTRVAAANFGLLRYVTYDGERNAVHVTSPFNISPGQGSTGYRFRVPQESISPNTIIIHSNSAVSPTGGPAIPGWPMVDIVEAATRKFGERFHEYVYLMGQQFAMLRDVVARLPGPRVPSPYPTGLEPNDYSGLLSEGIGISFDKAYHGVSIKVPVSVSFLNVAMPKNADSSFEAAKSMFYTMVHELGHHTRRGEHQIEDVMADMLYDLDAHPTFNIREYQQGLINTVERYSDVMLWLRGLYSDDYVTPIGKPLPVGEGQQEGDGSGAFDVRGPPDSAGWGSSLSDWAAFGPPRSGGRIDPGGGSATTAPTRGRGGKADAGLRANQRAINAETGHRDVPAAPRSAVTGPPRDAISDAFQGNPPPAAQAAAAHADRINWFYQWMAGILELAKVNPRFTPLIRYVEKLSLMHRDESQLQDFGVKIAKDWRSLGQKQSDAVMRLFDDIVNMTYLTPAERAVGVVRHETRPEFDAIVARYKINRAGLETYTRVREYAKLTLSLHTRNAMDAAARTISDPVALQKAIDEITAAQVNMEKRPYFPFMRFGTHFITVKDAKGTVVFFSLYERKGVRSAERVQQAALKLVERDFPGHDIKHGVMPPEVGPLYGMSPTLLKQMQQKMTLTPAQVDALEQLQFQMSPALSFRHRFQNKSYVPGYSKDFIRAFSSYAFHGARYYARTKYVFQLEDEIAAAGAVDGNKASRIRNYMIDHLQNTILDVRGDYGILKGAAFLWYMGFSPASAFINLTQTPAITYPWLASKFGDIRSTKALVNAMARIGTFYRKGTYQGMTDFHMKALGYGIRVGVVSETQAAELAGLANGNGLLYGVGGNVTQRAAHWGMEKAAFLFENAEQFNRRVAFRAALELAMNDPKNKYADQVVAQHQEEYNNLIAGVGTGPSRNKFTPAEARAILTAIDVVNTTQFVYHGYARPRFMRGRMAGTVFVFKRYIQGVVTLFLNGDRGYKLRYLLITMYLAGLMGIPGAEEFKNLINTIFRWIGYNMDIETAVRRHIKHVLGPGVDELMLHGSARRGFHVPAILDLMGSYATGAPGRGFLEAQKGQNVPAPMLDFSKALTPKLSPIDIGKLLDPYANVDKRIADQGAQGLGAVFSVGFNMFKAATNMKEEESDFKRWERSVPRQLGAISKAYRTWSEGRERFGGAGPDSARTFLEYRVKGDKRDTEHLMEVIFQGMGFNTLRQSEEWDFHRAAQEHRMYIEGTRKGLYEQLFEAIKGENDEERASVIEDIRKFNERVRGTPDAAYAITTDSIRRSMQTRARELGLREQGLSPRRAENPVLRDLREVYPNTIDVQKR